MQDDRPDPLVDDELRHHGSAPTERFPRRTPFRPPNHGSAPPTKHPPLQARVESSILQLTPEAEWSARNALVRRQVRAVLHFLG